MALLADHVWRDFTTDGFPTSGKHEPLKSEIREWGRRVEGLLNLQTLLADSTQWDAGQILITRAEQYGYEVAADAATDHQLVTAGGKKLYILSKGDICFEQGNCVNSAIDNGAAMQKVLDRAGVLKCDVNLYRSLQTSIALNVPDGVKIKGTKAAEIKAFGTGLVQPLLQCTNGTLDVERVTFTGNGNVMGANSSVGCLLQQMTVAATNDIEGPRIASCTFKGFACSILNAIFVVANPNYDIVGGYSRNNRYISIASEVRFPTIIGGESKDWQLRGYADNPNPPAAGVAAKGLVRGFVFDDADAEGAGRKNHITCFGGTRDITIKTRRIANYGANTGAVDVGRYGVLLYNSRYLAGGSVAATGVATLFTLTGLASTASYAVGADVSGTGVAFGATIASIDSATQVTLNKAHTGAVTSVVVGDDRYDPTNIAIESVRFENSQDCGIYYATIQNLRVVNCTFDGQTYNSDVLLPKGAIAGSGIKGRVSVIANNTIRNCQYGISTANIRPDALIALNDNNITSSTAVIAGVKFIGSGTLGSYLAQGRNNKIKLASGSGRGVWLETTATTTFSKLHWQGGEIDIPVYGFNWTDGSGLCVAEEVKLDGVSWRGPWSNSAVNIPATAARVVFDGYHDFDMSTATAHGCTLLNLTNLHVFGTLVFRSKPSNASFFAWNALNSQGSLSGDIIWRSVANGERFQVGSLGQVQPTWACSVGDVVKNINYGITGTQVMAWRGTATSGTWVKQQVTMAA